MWVFLSANGREKHKQNIGSCQPSVSLCHCSCGGVSGLLPVHDQSHLRGEAIATVHTQVPGHTRVCAHVGLQRCRLLEHLSTLGTFKRALLVDALVRRQTVDGGEGPVAEFTLLGLGTECYLLLCHSNTKVLHPLRSFVPSSQLLKATHDARLSALFVLSQEVHPLVLEEVFGGLEEKGAF